MKNEATISPTDLKKKFPVFSAHPDLVYLDNAATTHKTASVIDAMDRFYRDENANIQRGIYDLSQQATIRFDSARKSMGKFIGAANENCICFTSGATESINMVAFGFLKKQLRRGDNVVISIMEHHANFIPWQVVCTQTGAELRIVNCSDEGDIDLPDLKKKLDRNTRLLAITHINNTLGTINPVNEIIAMSHDQNIPVLIDAAQSAALYTINVQKTDCDFLVFSGHKIFGPQATGVLYAKETHHDLMDPLVYGGGAITEVFTDKTHFRDFPYRMEAGTPHIAGVIGLEQAIRFIDSLDRSNEIKKLNSLTRKTIEILGEMRHYRIVGRPNERSSIISFVHDDLHPHDIGSLLNEDMIAVRAGFHCTQPLLTRLKVPSTVRVSFSVYNGENDVEKLKESLKSIDKLMR